MDGKKVKFFDLFSYIHILLIDLKVHSEHFGKTIILGHKETNCNITFLIILIKQ